MLITVIKHCTKSIGIMISENVDNYAWPFTYYNVADSEFSDIWIHILICLIWHEHIKVTTPCFILAWYSSIEQFHRHDVFFNQMGWGSPFLQQLDRVLLHPQDSSPWQLLHHYLTRARLEPGIRSRETGRRWLLLGGFVQSSSENLVDRLYWVALSRVVQRIL